MAGGISNWAMKDGYSSFGLSDYLSEHLGKILIAAGIVFVVVGSLFIGDYYYEVPLSALIPCVLMFLGIVFVAYGLMIQVGFFSGKWFSIGGIGTILLCVSVLFFALTVVAIQVQLVSGFSIIDQIVGRAGRAIPVYEAVPDSVRPFLYVSGEALQLGLILFAAGVILKVSSFLKH